MHVDCAGLDEVPSGDWHCPTNAREESTLCAGWSLCDCGAASMAELSACVQAPDCVTAMHVECAGLDEVPTGDWHCPTHARQGSARRRASAGPTRKRAEPSPSPAASAGAWRPEHFQSLRQTSWPTHACQGPARRRASAGPTSKRVEPSEAHQWV